MKVKLMNIGLGLLLVDLVIFSCHARQPTLEELTRGRCQAGKPFKCLPYGVCYNADQFCYSGSIESCFPQDIPADQLELWCQSSGQNRSQLMRDPDLCTLACQARFPTLDLSNAVEKLVSIKCPTDRPLKCLPAGICHGFDEYCHAGQNKSCFDGGMSEGELLQWCQVHRQDDVSSMPDPSCKFACQVRFPASSNTVSAGSGSCCETAKALGGTLAGVVVLGILGLVLYRCVWRRRTQGTGDNIATGIRVTKKRTAEDSAEPLMLEQTPGVQDSGIASSRRLTRAMSDEAGNSLDENLRRREENATNQRMDAIDISIEADP